MLNFKKQLQHELLSALPKINFLGKFNFVVESPTLTEHGDYSTNLAMLLAKELKKPPLEIAKQLVEVLGSQSFCRQAFEKIEAVNPGFINFYFSKSYLSTLAPELSKTKKALGRSDLGKGEKIQLEFISANPTGPLTIGNGRGGFYGDVLGNVLKLCGFKVTKEYLINDAGQQIEKLGHSVLKDEQAVYRGDYIDDLIKHFGKKLLQPSDPFTVGQSAAGFILKKEIKPTVEKKMQIKINWFSETDQLRKTKKIKKVIDFLKKKDLLYQQDGAWWFKSQQFGDTRDRVLVKTDGGYTYLAQDFAYTYNKFIERKFDRAIIVLGADHHGDVPGLINAAAALGFTGKQQVILLQFVRLTQSGQEVRMSKRRGTYVTMSELIDQVGHDVARFLFLMYSPNSHIDFDLALATERSDKNPVYYVQYAYARLANILKQPALRKKPKNPRLELLEHPSEISLIRELIKWPEILEEAAKNYQVQLLPLFALNLADKFHQFYDHCRVISNDQVNCQRADLVSLTKKVFKEVLTTIGVSTPEKM